jgi:hypothetical protein
MEIHLRLGCLPDIFENCGTREPFPLHVAVNFRPMYPTTLYKFGSNPELRIKNPQQAAAIHLARTAYTMPAWTYRHVQYPSIYPDDAKNATAA